MNGYNFKDVKCDAQYLIPILNILGDNLIGIELGVGKGYSTLSLVANCGNIEKMYAVDSFQPYQDKLKNPYDNTPAYDVNKADVEFDKLTFYHNLKYSGLKDRITVIENDKHTALNVFENDSFDFIFADAHHDYEDTITDIKEWYPKLKVGGIFAMHDTNNEMVKSAIKSFRKENNITNHISDFDNTTLWIKTDGR